MPSAEQVRAAIDAYAAAYIKDVVVCGNEAAMVFQIHAGSGDGPGIVLDVVDTFEVDDDGKVTLMKAYWDMNRAAPAT